MDLQLNNKKAFVSGSTAGIGLAITRRLLIEGATVVISGRSASGVDKAVADLEND